MNIAIRQYKRLFINIRMNIYKKLKQNCLKGRNRRLKGWHWHLKARHWLLIALLLLVTLTKMNLNWGFIYTFVVYPHIASVLSHISGIFPFAIGDLFIALSIAWAILYPIYELVFKRIAAKRAASLSDTVPRVASGKVVFGRVVEYLLWVYIWFYLAWGLNYSQPNVFLRMRMMPAQVSKETLREFANRYVDTLNALSKGRFSSEERRGKSEESNSISELEISQELAVSQELKDRTSKMVFQGYQNLAKSQQFMGINAPFNNHPCAKTMMFSPISSMAGVTGSMGPFFCEFTLNGNVLSPDYPATYAHEFAHLLGVANEGEANFYSYLVCTASPDRDMRFSGYYHILYYVIGNVDRILGVQEGNALIRRINPEIIALTLKERKYWKKKRSKALDAAQDFIFDLYLKGNKVQGGRKSYSAVMTMILSWEEKNKKVKNEEFDSL